MADAGFGHGKNGATSGFDPGLREREATHEMSHANSGRSIGAKDQTVGLGSHSDGFLFNALVDLLPLRMLGEHREDIVPGKLIAAKVPVTFCTKAKSSGVSTVQRRWE